jgi:hypothetical protein
MTPRAIIAKTLIDEYLGKAKDEWRNMYHAAKIRKFPYEDNQADYFWGYVRDMCNQLCEQLHEDVKEEFGFDWKFYSWGRSGGTIAPDLFGMSRYFKSNIDDDDVLDIAGAGYGYYGDDEDDEDDDVIEDDVVRCLESIKEVWGAFKMINETIKGDLEYLEGEGWNEYKDGLVMEDDEDEDEDELDEEGGVNGIA